jgi:hypothetical protein
MDGTSYHPHPATPQGDTTTDRPLEEEKGWAGQLLAGIGHLRTDEFPGRLSS